MKSHTQQGEEAWQAVTDVETRLDAARTQRDAARATVSRSNVAWSDEEDDYANLRDADRLVAMLQDKLQIVHTKRAAWLQLDDKYYADYKEQTQ